MSYGTIPAVRRHAKDITADKVSDEDIQAYLDEASTQIDIATRRNWGKHTGEIEFHDGNKHHSLFLRKRPALAVTKVERRNAEATAFEDLDPFDPSTAEGDYVLEDKGAGVMRWTSSEHPTSGIQSVRVTYDYGYDPTPAYINSLASIMAAIDTLNQDAGRVTPDGLTSITEGALSLNWGAGAHAETIKNLTEKANKILREDIGKRLQFATSLPNGRRG